MKNQMTSTTASTTITSSTLWMAVVVTISTIGTMVAIHATYMTQLIHRSSSSSFSLPSNILPDTNTRHVEGYRIPELFIYRRTKKTGSSSMLTALLEHLIDVGYTPLYYEQGEEMDAVVRNEYLPTHATWDGRRNLLIAEHNRITKAFHPNHDAVIADTVRDGYQQITSYCRYVKKVQSCRGEEMISCLRNENTTYQNVYRWAGREAEDVDTYIDLPLSSAHPALSTSVLRRVFPNITLDVSRFNVRSSSCKEYVELRQVYNELYVELDNQVQTLRERMLILTGYPYRIDKNIQSQVSLEDVMKQAESVEKQKYEIESTKKKQKVRGYSESHHELMRMTKHWTLKDGELTIKSRRK